MNLISLEEAKSHLYVDHDSDDSLIEGMIAGASGAVLNYLKESPIGTPERDGDGRIVRDTEGNAIYLRDSSGNVIPRPEIRAAVRIFVGEFYKNREAEQSGRVDGQYGYGYLPQPVIALLFPLRDPALA